MCLSSLTNGNAPKVQVASRVEWIERQHFKKSFRCLLVLPVVVVGHTEIVQQTVVRRILLNRFVKKLYRLVELCQ